MSSHSSSISRSEAEIEYTFDLFFALHKKLAIDVPVTIPKDTPHFHHLLGDAEVLKICALKASAKFTDKAGRMGIIVPTTVGPLVIYQTYDTNRSLTYCAPHEFVKYGYRDEGQAHFDFLLQALVERRFAQAV